MMRFSLRPVCPGAVAAAALAIGLAVSSAAHGATTGNLSGRIVDEESGRPLAGVSVVVAGPRGEQSVLSDKEGRYRIIDLEPGAYQVSTVLGSSRIEGIGRIACRLRGIVTPKRRRGWLSGNVGYVNSVRSG